MFPAYILSRIGLVGNLGNGSLRDLVGICLVNSYGNEAWGSVTVRESKALDNQITVPGAP